MKAALALAGLGLVGAVLAVGGFIYTIGHATVRMLELIGVTP